MAIKSIESIHDKVHESYPGMKTNGRGYIPSVPLLSKQFLTYLETLAYISVYYRQVDVRISGKYDSIYWANLSRYDTFTNKELHEKIAVKLAKWVQMFPHKDDKGINIADEEDEAGDADCVVAASGGVSGSGAKYAVPGTSEDE